MAVEYFLFELFIDKSGGFFMDFTISWIFIKENTMNNEKLNSALNNYMEPKNVRNVSNDGMEREECDLKTGECYIIRSKDGIVERINKKFITEDGRQLLQD